MDLILTTFGTYLHRSGELFLIKIDNTTQEISSRKVRSILITIGASLSTDAIELAIEKNIDLIFLDKFGDPYGRIWHGKLGSTTAIRRQQLRIADTEAGFQLALAWMVRKIDNQLDYLDSARQKRTRLSSSLTESIEKLTESRNKIAALSGTLAEMRSTIFQLEMKAAKLYWQTINLLLPESYRFEQRSRRPAQDEFNCLLNYAYGVLYGVVERSCVLAGLDPYVGFIHTDDYNKQSFVFDLIECYRIWADESVVNLFANRQIKQNLFDKLHNGLTLNQDGKAVLLNSLVNFLDEKIHYNRRQVQRREIVQLDCHHIANQLIDKNQ
ncbi:CRISPR-associated protein, Cas1 family [Thioploca ingrica]|uniref:CRISPR-associated endonuclease Cas1 n=1 Tax=Thioploca ingrica TaxID=40754 RepID=A0A090ADI8_9GAMM|nr:CRISPR-associated protein, Cas1 family [Thioploca ingrica]